MRILVTGSSGMIGTALCERLSARHDVVGVDRVPNEWNPEVGRISRIIDVTSDSELSGLPAVDLVIHCAANARVFDLVKNPEYALENVVTTYNVLEYMRRAGVGRMIFTSSREVYGSLPAVEQVSEEMVDIRKCESPYTASKIAGESFVYSYARVYGVKNVVVRLSNVYGRYDMSTRVVPTWIRCALEDRPMIVFGPEKVLDFTYLDDAVDGISRAAERFDDVAGSIFNLSYGKRESLLAVAHLVKQLTGSASEIVADSSRPGELWTYRGDIRAARTKLGFHPLTDINAGLTKSIEWYRSRSSPERAAPAAQPQATRGPASDRA